MVSETLSDVGAQTDALLGLKCSKTGYLLVRCQTHVMFLDVGDTSGLLPLEQGDQSLPHA